MRRFSIFTSFILVGILCLSSCSQSLSPVIKDYGYFQKEKESQKFNTSISFWTKQFSGLTIIKKKGEIWHIAMITEVGMKLFEFSYDGNEMKIIDAIEPLYNKNFIEILKIDFEMILKEHVLLSQKTCGNKITTFKTEDKYKLIEKSDQKTVKKMGSFGYSRKITFRYNKDLSLKKMKIKNRGLNLQIELTPLN